MLLPPHVKEAISEEVWVRIVELVTSPPVQVFGNKAAKASQSDSDCEYARDTAGRTQETFNIKTNII